MTEPDLLQTFPVANTVATSSSATLPMRVAFMTKLPSDILLFSELDI